MTEITNKFSKAQRNWLEALESGKFKQIKAKLHTEEGFCCLGVACEISNKITAEFNSNQHRFEYNGKYGALPEVIQNELYLRSASGFPERNGKGIKDGLTELNDNKNKTFLEIATHLRTFPSAYFTNFDTDPTQEQPA